MVDRTLWLGLIYVAALLAAALHEGPSFPLAEAPAVSTAPADELDPAQRALARHLARRFYVGAELTERIVAAAHHAGDEVALDPLLVLAVIAVESSFNPDAESRKGAKGLMQIIPRYHGDKLRALGGEDAVLDPESNIHLGARILQEYVRSSGTLVAGLQWYNGASRDPNARYAGKVLAERARLALLIDGDQRGPGQAF
jgi:soluble lytic murein transglycosylase-like protein